jgi:hypothetical protein
MNTATTTTTRNKNNDSGRKRNGDQTDRPIRATDDILVPDASIIMPRESRESPYQPFQGGSFSCNSMPTCLPFPLQRAMKACLPGFAPFSTLNTKRSVCTRWIFFQCDCKSKNIQAIPTASVSCRINFASMRLVVPCATNAVDVAVRCLDVSPEVFRLQKYCVHLLLKTCNGDLQSRREYEYSWADAH